MKFVAVSMLNVTKSTYVVDDDNVLVSASSSNEAWLTTDAAQTSGTVQAQTAGLISRPTVRLPVDVQKQLNIQLVPGEELYILTKVGNSPLVELSFAPTSAVFLT